MKCLGCDAEIEGENAEFCDACLAVCSSPTASASSGRPAAAAMSRGRTAFAPRLQSGTVIAGRYRIVRHLGSGGMGMVYQADDLKLKVAVALKFLHPAEATNPRHLELFLNEVRLARQITHPNVCRLFDVGDVDGQHFLSMEHVAGEDLASLLRRIGRLPKDRAIAIALEICRGLEAAHDRGILHRDLKPSNLMIDARGQAKIMDFGLANFSRALGVRSEIAGTPDYMAPEQRRGEASIRSEVYALGLVLYELFTGRKIRREPLRGDSTSDNSPLPSVVLDDVDPLLERLIRHCLEQDPRLRPSSVGAVATALTKLTVPPWWPVEGAAIPHRKHWVLQRRLGQGGFGETWLAEHQKTHDCRVFKFCNDSGKLKGLQREITLFRFMRETLGGRDDIAPLVDWQLDEPPYFIESEFAGSINLSEWICAEGGMEAVPLRTRLEIVQKVALALSAAHSVGILHKDVKPANVLVRRDADGIVKVRLCDFGVSVLTDEARLQAAGVTAAGMTDVHEGPSPDAGTRLYMAPELLEGKPATTSADAYALGVMLYQLVIGDLTRALAPGWDREVEDELLREDIAAAVEGTPDRRLGAPQLADRLRLLPERAAARQTEIAESERARAAEQAVRRRRNWATAALSALLLLGVGLGIAFERAESSARQALIDHTLRSNEAMGRLAAAAISDKLEEAIRRVKEEAADPTLRNLLQRMDTARDERTRAPLRTVLQRHLDELFFREQPKVHSWAVSDSAAFVWARSPYDPGIIGQNYRYREWFNGRVELPADFRGSAEPRNFTGFSLAFTSTAQDKPLLIGLASPVFSIDAEAARPRIVGILNAGLHLETLNGWLEVGENRPPDGECPERFVLLIHRAQLLRHPCPSSGSASLPVTGFSEQPAVAELLKAPGRQSASFHDPVRTSGGSTRDPALAVSVPLERLSDWVLILEQDVHVALKPIISLTTDFHRPAHFAFALGILAFIPLVGLLWWSGRERFRLGPHTSRA